MAHRGSNFQNPYSGGTPGSGYRSQSPRNQSPRFSGSPRGGPYYNPRGFSPNRGPSPQHMQHGRGGPSPQHMQHGGRGRGQFSPSNYQQSPYTPGYSPRYQQWDGGNRGRGGRGRGRGYGTPGGRGRGSHGGGGAPVEHYYKHSMVEDPWRTLIANSQEHTET